MPGSASRNRMEKHEELKGGSHKSERRKERQEKVEMKDAKEESKEGKSPGQNLPIEDYDSLNVDQVAEKLQSLSREEVQRLKSYELEEKKRKTLIERMDGVLAKDAGKGEPGAEKLEPFSNEEAQRPKSHEPEKESMPESWLTPDLNWALVGAGVVFLLWIIL